jgi:lipid-binding SYLF domain-containing protein
MRSLFISLVVVALGVAAGCSTAPKTEAKRDNLRADSDVALDRFQSNDQTTRDFLNGSKGYAVFPHIGKGGAIAGGAYGHGALYENGQFVGYCDMTQASVGAQLGGQSYSELIVFENTDTLNRFKSGNFTFGANASAVANKEGAARAARFQNGVAVFVHPNAGLMGEAAISGQKFNFVTSDNAPTPKDRDYTAHTD